MDEKSLLDADFTKSDDSFDNFGKEAQQALGYNKAFAKTEKDDNQVLRDLVKFHKGYLNSQNIQSDTFSDQQVLLDLSQQVASKGMLDQFPILKNVLIREKQNQARDSVYGDGALGNLYWTAAPFQGLEKGTYMAGGMTAGTVGAIGDYTGISTPGSDSIAESLMRVAGESGGPVKSLKDGTLLQPFTFDFDDNGNLTGEAQSFGGKLQNTVDFGLNAIGEVVPTMGLVIFGGGAGQKVARKLLKVSPEVLQKKVVGKALNKEITRLQKSTLAGKSSNLSPYRTALLNDRGKAYAALGREGQQVASAYMAAWGNVVGATMTSGTLGVGEVYNTLIPYTRLPKSHQEHIDVDDAVGYSLLFGAAIGGLDALMPSKVGGALIKKFYPKKSIISTADVARADNMVRKSLIKATTMGMAVEGSTEAAQEFLNMTAEKFAKARQVGEEGFVEDLGDSVSFDFTDQEMWQLVDAGALGMVGGGFAGLAITQLDNSVQLPKRIKQKQEFDDAIAAARQRNNLVRSDLKQEIEDKARAQFERKTLAEGDSVVLPNGQEATFIRPIGDGRGLVSYTDQEGKVKNVKLAMPLITLNSDLTSNVVTRAERREAIENVDLIDQQAPETTETPSVIDELKAEADVAQESSEDEAEDKEEEPKENLKAKFRDTPVEGVDNLTKGDELAYTLLSKGGIYDKDITTDRLIDGEVTDGLKGEIDTTLYNSWWKNTYDTKFESQPSKGAMIEAFRRAHKIKHPTGRPTEGDKKAEQTRAEAEKAKQQTEEKKEAEKEKAEIDKKEADRNARIVNLGKSNYETGSKIRITQARANNAAQYIPERSLGAEFTVESVDDENGVVIISDGQGGTYRADPRDFTNPIKEASTPKTSDPKDVPAFQKEEVKMQGKDMSALPELKNGTYVVQFGSKKSVIIVEENGWRFRKGSLSGEDVSRPNTFGELIQRGSYGIYDVTSVRFEDEYIVNVNFDGVAFNYALNKDAPQEIRTEPIPIKGDEDNGKWVFQGQTTDLLDPEQTHLQVRDINKIEGVQKKEEIQNLTEYKATKKNQKARPDLPGKNQKPSGNQSNAVIAILHKPSGQVFVRSVKKSKGSLSIYKFNRPRTDKISALPSAYALDYNKLPSEFQTLEVVLFSSRPGTLRLNLQSEQEYRNWIDSIPVIEFQEKKRDPSNHPRANQLQEQYEETGEFTDEFALHFDLAYVGKGITYYTDEATEELLVNESIGVYVPAKGKRRAWHYIKTDQIVEQLGEAVQPTLDKIDAVIKGEKTLADLNDDVEVMAGHIKFLQFGEGVEDSSKNPQIDTRTLSEFYNTEEKAGKPLISERNKKAIAGAFVESLYRQKKRRSENETSGSQETSLGEDESGNEKLVNIGGGESISQGLEATEIDTIIEQLDFNGKEPVEIARMAFFPNFTNDQLRIIYNAGQQIDVEATTEQVVQQLGIQIEAIKDLPRVAPEARGTLTTVHDMVANTDALANPNSPDATAIGVSAAAVKYLGQNFTPQQIDEEIAKSSPSVSFSSDQAFDAEIAEYKKLQIPVRNLFETAVKNVNSELELSDQQKELLSTAYSSILKSVRLPSESLFEVEDAFFAIAEAFNQNGALAFGAMEDAMTPDIQELKDKVFDKEGNDVTEQTLDIFFEFLKSVKGQVLKENTGHYTMLMHEHLGFATTPLILPHSGFAKEQLETGAIENVTSAPNKPPVENMQDPVGGQSLPIMEDVNEQTIKHADNVARAQKSNLVQFAAVSNEQRTINDAAMEEVFPSDLPGSNFSAVALQSINAILNKEGTVEGKNFGGEMVNVLTQMLDARNSQGLPSIRFDNTTPLDAEPGYHTRGQFLPDPERPTVFINPDYYLGDNDSIGEPFPLTGSKERDILMLIAMHELWHGTMEEALHAHEAKISRDEVSELQETIDLIDEVIDQARSASTGTRFSSLFIKSNKNSRREILNRAWNRRDFAEFLSGIEVSEDLQNRIDKNGKGFINNLLDALYGAYLKLLKAIGIETDGTALKALLDLNRQLDARHRLLEPQDNAYAIPVDELAAMEDSSNNILPDTEKVTEAGQIGVDKKQLMALLGPTMYEKPIAQVAVKELLQNSFDAVKTRINLTDNKDSGKIDIDVDREARVIKITDDGMGMTPDIVKNAFLNIGGTNKEGLDVGERSGGFGLAKVQFLLGSDYVKVTTVRDGKMTELNATADQLYNDNFEITTSRTSEPNGTTVEVKIPSEYTTATGETKRISFFWDAGDIEALGKPLIGNVDVTLKLRNYSDDVVEPEVVEIGNNANLPPLFTNVAFDWGTAEVYISENKPDRGYPKHEILSSGVYQFNEDFTIDPNDTWTDNIPYDIIVNIKPGVATNAEQYPFNNQREGFKPTVTEDVKSLRFYLAKFASGEADKAAKQRFDGIIGLPKIDPDAVLTEEERNKIFGEIADLRESNEDRREDAVSNELEQWLGQDIKITKDGISDKDDNQLFSKEDFKSSFKADEEIQEQPKMDIGKFDPSQPQYHNNTTTDYTKTKGAIEFFSDIGSVVHDLVRFAGDRFGYRYEVLKSPPSKKYFAGVSIDKGYGGVHVNDPFKAVFINPLSFNPSNKEEAAGLMLHIALHEIAHTTQKNEGAPFTSELARVYALMYQTERYGYYEGLFRSVFTRHFETYKNLINEYDKLSTKNIAESFTGDTVEGFQDRDSEGDASDARTGELPEGGSRGDKGSTQESADQTGEVIQSQLGHTDARLIRAKTRTHISIEKVGDDQFKITGLAQDEVLTAREIREGLVRLKAMPSRVGVLKLDENGKPLVKKLIQSGDSSINIPEGAGDLFMELANEAMQLESLSDSEVFGTPPVRSSNFTSQGSGNNLFYLPKDVLVNPQRTAQLKKQLKETAKRLDDRFNLGLFESTLKRRQDKGFKGGLFNEVEAMGYIYDAIKNPPKKVEYHIFREGTETELIPVSELEAYNVDDVAEMSDQMDLNFQGKVDNSLNYIVIENATPDLQKGQILPKHKANMYRDAGVMFMRYDEYLKEKEAGEEVVEDIPDVVYKESTITANQTLVKYLAYYFPWGSDNLKDYSDLVDRAFKRLGIPKHRIRKEIDSIENLFAITPNGKRGKFQWLAINRGLKIPPNQIGDFMSDPTVSPAQGLQGNVMPEENSKALAKATAASVNESSIPVAYAAQTIRQILGNPDLSVDEIWNVFLKGKTPTKKLNELIKQYGEEMEYQTIELHKNSENTRDQARVEAIKRIENQIKHILKQTADIDSDLDPTRPGSIESRIAKFEERTILDESHLFDRSKYGDEIRSRIDAYASTTAQAIIEETGEEETDIILNAYRNITGKGKTDEDFHDSLDRVMSSSSGGGIASNKIADLILEVSKIDNIQALNAEAIYKIIRPSFNNEGRAVILSAVMADRKDLIYLAKISQSTDMKARRDLNAKLQTLARANMNELKVLDSENSSSYFPTGNQFEKDIQKIFVKDRIELLKAQDEKENAIKKQLVYQELFNEFDVESKRLLMLLGHNPAKQLNDGDKFPVMTKVDGEYVMSEITVQMSNLMQFENFEELKTAISLNKQYLRDQEGNEDNDYRYVKQMVMNAEIMPIWNAQYETGGMFRLHSLKSARERFQTAGPLGRQIAQMILQFENGYRRYTPQIKAMARTWNEAFDDARNAFGYSEGHLFMDDVIGKTIKWNEDQPQLSGDKETFLEEAWKYASALVPSEQLTVDAREALDALWSEYERSADFHREIAEQLGLKVADEKVTLRDPMGRPYETKKEVKGKGREAYGTYLFRDAITRGYLTVPRLLRSDYIQTIVTEMPKYGWATEVSDGVKDFSWKFLGEVMKSKEVDQATKAQQVEDATNTLVNDYIWERFMLPYIRNTSPRELFDQPKKGLKVPRSELMKAWEATAGKSGADAFNTWVEVLYDNLGTGKKDRSDFVQFKYNILKTYKGRFNRLKKSVSNMGKQGVDSSIAMAGHLMDSRSQDAIIPAEFLRYTTYDEVTSPALLAKTLENVYFGRNGEKLKNTLEQLAGKNGEMTVKMQKLRSLASYVGAIPNPTGKQKFTRQQRTKAYEVLETDPEFENVPGKTGKEKFENLKNTESIMKSVFGSEVGEGATKHLNAYLNGDLGPFQDEKMFYELLGLNAYFVLNQPKSGVTNLMSIWDFDSKYGGMGKASMAAQLFGSWTAASEILGGIMANFGVDIGTKGYESDILMPLFFNTYENDLGFKRATLNVGSGAVKRSVLFGKDFRYDILRPLKAAMDYDPRRGSQVKNEEGRRKYAPFSGRTLFLKPFSYFGALANHSIAVANARMVSNLVHEVATYIEQVNAIQAENGGALLPEDYQVTSEELGKKLSDKIAYDRLNLDLEVYGLGTISNLARDYLNRRSKGDKRILTKEQVIVSGFVGQNEVALEGGFATTPAMLNSKYMRWAAPLQKWALNKVKNMNEAPRDVKTGKFDAQAALLMLANIIALKIPLGLAYTFFWSDWYDEELLGKASPLRPLSKKAMIPLIGPFLEGDPANNMKAMLERTARAGNVGGMALDFANTMYNGMDTYSYNRGFTLDSRILLASQVTNIGQALRNWVHMDFQWDYANVTRPLLYSMGMNGPLQQYNLFANFLGHDSEERRISTQIGNRHKLRAGIHTLGIESRPMVGGGIGKTRFSAAVRRMERSAEADDYKGFNKAYEEAIEASIDRGDDDPEDAVIKAFKRRNLKTGISRYKLSDEEWNGILNLYEKEAAQSLIDSMNAHDKYVDILDASKPKKFKPKPVLQPATYDELIRRSLSF